MQNLLKTAIFSAVLISPVAAMAQTPTTPVPAGMTCRGDQVVWVNTKSHVYHTKGERYFGSTKHGKYLCKKAADAEGDHMTKNGQ